MNITTNTSWMKRTAIFVFTIFFALVLTIAVKPANASAATKAVKKQKFVTVYKTVNKKAITVKKGTTKLKVTEGFVKFKAPKTGKYSFTVSNLKTVGVASASDIGNGFMTAYFKNASGSSINSGRNFSTKGGKDTTLWFGTAKSASYETGKVTTYTRLLSRTGKIKLKKGETVYLFFYVGNKPCTLNLKIK